jgi:hypothetical protein
MPYCAIALSRELDRLPIQKIEQSALIATWMSGGHGYEWLSVKIGS